MKVDVGHFILIYRVAGDLVLKKPLSLTFLLGWNRYTSTRFIIGSSLSISGQYSHGVRPGNTRKLKVRETDTETVARRCFLKNVFLKILENSQENTSGHRSQELRSQENTSRKHLRSQENTSGLRKTLHVSGKPFRSQVFNFIKKRALAQVFPVNFAKFSRTPFYRTPPVAASQIITSKSMSLTLYSRDLAATYVEC